MNVEYLQLAYDKFKADDPANPDGNLRKVLNMINQSNDYPREDEVEMILFAWRNVLQEDENQIQRL